MWSNMNVFRRSGLRLFSGIRRSTKTTRVEKSCQCLYVTSYWNNRSLSTRKTMPSFFSKFFSCVSSHEGPVLPTEGLVMKTVDCNWMKVENGEAHRTSEYETNSLVLRRGQTFKVKITFQRPYNSAGDKVILEFGIGSAPQLVNDTKIRVPISSALNPAKWSMVLEDTDDKTITVEVNVPANAIVGRYKTAVEFESKLQDGTIAKSRDPEPDVIVLFNAWCKDDTVYIEDEDKRFEYVLNDSGNVYRGSTRRISPKKWNFGQFEPHVLDSALHLLNKDKRTSAKGGKWLPKRRDPVWVVRVMSAQINDCVLEGNWSGSYEGGVSPTAWSGSVKILQEYLKKDSPVRFGQCWVFSGVMTTVLRALGIPTRSVTNFASAHDTESSMTIDSYFDTDGNEVNLGGDSVWNFHVWNESWMTRPDLPQGYDGWQVIDATPQEESLGLFQTGPAPVKAVKSGEVYLGYETPFVFAEVNADRVQWIVTKGEDDSYEISKIGRRNPSAVGKYISTKKVGSDEREDLTLEYKHPEYSDEERAAFKKAYGFGAQPEYQKGFLALQEEDLKDGVDFEFTTNPVDEELFNGDDFVVKMTIKNKSSEKRTIDVVSSLHATTYTGVNKAFVKRSKFAGIEIEANATVEKEFQVIYKDYGGKLVDHNALRMVSVATVKESGKMFSEDFELRLENKEDKVEIVINEPLKVGKKSSITVKVTNPLPVKLTNVTFTLEGSGILSSTTQKHSGHILPGEKAESTFTVTPTKKANGRLILADIDARQLQDMKQYDYVDVAPADPKPEPPAPQVTPAEAPTTTEIE